MLKKKKQLILFIAILTILLVSSFSYAWFIYSDVQDDSHIGSTACFKLSFEERNDISLRNAIPVEDSEGMTYTPYTFTVTNVCEGASSYYVTLEDLIESNIDLDGVKYQLNDDIPQILGNIITNENHVLESTKSSRTLASGILLEGESVSYNLRLWIDINSTSEQTAEKIFKSKVVVVSNWNKDPYWNLTLVDDLNNTNESIQVVKGRKITALPNPTKEDYRFLGWLDSDDNEITEQSILNSDTIIHAKWLSLYVNIALENSKFTDNTTNKTLRAGDVVTINAIIPSNYTESSYSGQTSCSSANDVGNIKYKIKHEYSLEDWNILDTQNQQITYTVPELETNSMTIRANIKDEQTQTGKLECYQKNRSYSQGYYYCDGSDSLSNTTCSYTTTSGYTAPYYTCNGNDIRNGTTCTHSVTATQNSGWVCPSGCSPLNGQLEGRCMCGTFPNVNMVDATWQIWFTCSSGQLSAGACLTYYDATSHAATCSSGTVSGSSCLITYNAHYSSGYYYCSSGVMSGSYCYATRSVS